LVEAATIQKDSALSLATMFIRQGKLIKNNANIDISVKHTTLLLNLTKEY
jgi:hypothetical protein